MRSIGYPGLAAALDRLLVWSPFVSVVVLLLVGFLVTMNAEGRESHLLLVKLPLVCLVALIPLVVHFAMIKLTVTVDSPPPQRLFGPLSLSSWVTLVVGCFLIIGGICFLVRTRNSSVSQS
jgi:hypothetical protein